MLAEWFPVFQRILVPSFTESSTPRRILTQVFIGAGTCTVVRNYVTVLGGSGGEVGAHSMSE